MEKNFLFSAVEQNILFKTIPVSKSQMNVSSHSIACFLNFGLENKRKESFSLLVYEPRSEKTGLRGFRPGPTKTRLYNHTRWLEA